MTAHLSTQVTKCSDCLATTAPTFALTLSLSPLADSRDSFRLLTLKAGSADEPLIATVGEFRRSTNPVYECLSYTWLSDASDAADHRSRELDLLKPMTVNGDTVAITDNLWCALRAIRNQKRHARCIWVDALCICQHDAFEKSQQVKMIGVTFRNASQVWCWFTSDTSFHELSGYVDDVRKLSWPAQKQDAQPPSELLSRLCLQPYFTRLWVLQEIILAKSVTMIFGETAIEGSDFERLVIQLARAQQRYNRIWHKQPDPMWRTRVGPSLEYVRTIFELRKQYESALSRPSSIWHYLSIFYDSKCHDPRDRIYSLLSLVESAETQDILPEPDYTIDVATLYLKFAWSTYAGEKDAAQDEIMWELFRALGSSDKESVLFSLYEHAPSTASEVAYSAFRKALVKHVFFDSGSSRWPDLDPLRYINELLLVSGQVDLGVRALRFRKWFKAERTHMTWRLGFYGFLLLPVYGFSVPEFDCDQTRWLYLDQALLLWLALSMAYVVGQYYSAKDNYAPVGRFRVPGPDTTGTVYKHIHMCVRCLDSWRTQARPTQVGISQKA